MRTKDKNINGLTLIELVVILGCCIFLCLLLLPNLQSTHHSSRRVNCLANLNGLHKGLASWGLDPSDPWRPTFPPTNMHVALQNMGISPRMFICPKAAGMNDSFSGPYPKTFPKRSVNRSIGIYPATNTANLAASNCNYNYWTLRTENDGDKILVCDRNGVGNASNAVGSWGGNHGGEGGNFVKVAGEGKWMGTNDILALNAADAGMFNLSSNATAMGVVTNN